MTLNFMTLFSSGGFTLFCEKILLNFSFSTRQKYIEDMAIQHCLSNNIDENAQIFSMQKERYSDRFNELKPKIHTLRKGKRWSIGRIIHFKVWTGKPYKSKTMIFAPNVRCTQCQDVEIFWREKKAYIFIDGRELETLYEVNILAINDGFDSIEHFLQHFNKNFKGQIIGWTDFKY